MSGANPRQMRGLQYTEMGDDDIAAQYEDDSSVEEEKADGEEAPTRIKPDERKEAEMAARKRDRDEKKAERAKERQQEKEKEQAERAKERKEEKAVVKEEREKERKRAKEDEAKARRGPGQGMLRFTMRRQQREEEEGGLPAHLLSAAAAGGGDDDDVDIEQFLGEKEAGADDLDDLLGGDVPSANDILFSNFAAAEEDAGGDAAMPDAAAPAAAAADDGAAGGKRRKTQPPPPPPAAAAAPKPAAPPPPPAVQTPAAGGAPPTAGKRNFTVQQAKAAPAAAGGTGHSFAPAAGAPRAAPAAGASNKIGEPGTQIWWSDAREDGVGALGLGGGTNPGTVFLIGKVATGDGEFASCCVRVRGLPRQVYFLPRRFRDGTEETEEIPIIEAQREVSRWCKEKGIDRRKVKPVDRWYGFEEEGVPRDCSRWLKLSYEARFGPLGLKDKPSDAIGKQLSTVSHSFGDGRSFLETFLLKRELKGPCWLTLWDCAPVADDDRLSWCKYEFEVSDYKKVERVPDDARMRPPPLRVMSVGLHTYLNEKAVPKANEVVAMSCVTWKQVNCDGVSPAERPSRWAAARGVAGRQLPMEHLLQREFKKAGLPEPAPEISERQMLMRFLEWMQAEDPDVLVGHNFIGFDLDVLLHRMDKLKIHTWSQVGRLRLRNMPRLQHGAGGTGEATWEEKNVIAGRVVADSYLLTKEYHKSQNYKLRSLAAEMHLKGVRGVPLSDADVELPQIADLAAWMAQPEGVLDVVTRCDDKALLAWGVLEKLQAIPLTKRLTSLAGNLWSRTLTGSRAERIEYLLMHRFHKEKYVLPDKRSMKYREENSVKRKSKYAGGMVLEPEKGLYTDYVLLLDFNSLYPSLIQEYKVCFTTVRRPKEGESPEVPDDAALVCTKCAAAGYKPAGQGMDGSCPHRCVLPKAIRELVVARREVKKMLKTERDPVLRAVYDIRQKALKLTANSIYGCLGFEHSRFYAQSLAELVTSQGRTALTATKELVDNMRETTSLRVIYGDTDSVMLSTGITTSLKEALVLANRVKNEVNKRYTNLEIDIDGVFRSIILVRKKKYAAMTIEDWQGEGKVLKQEVKGLDLVRRDWCKLSGQVQDFVLNSCLSGREQDTIIEEIFTYLAGMCKRVRCEDGEDPIPLEKYIIRKSITKELGAYQDKENQPHVVVAERRKAQNESVQVGDIIQYIICRGGKEGAAVGGKLSERAYHPDEVKADEKLLIDDEWYLATQIHPPVTRLCEHIPGLDSRALSHALGLENSKLVQHTSAAPSAGAGGGDAEYHISARGSRALDDRFPHRAEVKVRCPKCSELSYFDPTACFGAEARRVAEHTEKMGVLPSDKRPLVRCELRGCGATIPVAAVHNAVVHEARAMLRRYYSNEYGLQTHFGGYNPNTVKAAYRESHVRQQCQFLRARFGERELGQELETCYAALTKERKVALRKALAQNMLRERRHDRAVPEAALLAKPQDLLRELRRHLERHLVDADGRAAVTQSHTGAADESNLSKLGTYTNNLSRSAERNHIDAGALFGCLAARAPTAAAVASPARAPVTQMP